MAEEGGAPHNPFIYVLYWAIGLALAWYVFQNIVSQFQSIGDLNTYIVSMTGGPDGWYGNVLIFIDQVVTLYIQISTIVSALLILGTAYAFMRVMQIKWATKKKEAEFAKKVTEKKVVKGNDKWEKVMAHVNSENPAEWRLAILEADVMLEELLGSMNFRGETLGEKLKNADPSSFKNLQAAWEAHKVRNSIAHEGANFLVNQREAKRVIDLFERVFKEFNFV